jgi:hypothetical protein
MPLAAPVMMATLPLRSDMAWLPYVSHSLRQHAGTLQR